MNLLAFPFKERNGKINEKTNCARIGARLRKKDARYTESETNKTLKYINNINAQKYKTRCTQNVSLLKKRNSCLDTRLPNLHSSFERSQRNNIMGYSRLKLHFHTTRAI